MSTEQTELTLSPVGATRLCWRPLVLCWHSRSLLICGYAIYRNVRRVCRLGQMGLPHSSSAGDDGSVVV